MLEGNSHRSFPANSERPSPPPVFSPTGKPISRTVAFPCKKSFGEQARARGLLLPAEAFAYLFLRAPRDMRSLTALLMAIDRYSLEHQRPVTLSLLREVLQTPLER